MKRLFTILAMALLFAVPIFAANKTLNCSWNQTLPSPNDLAGWGLYQSSTSGGSYTKILDIQYVSQQTKYTATTAITVPDGATTTLYFALDAVDGSGNRSAKSNQVTVVIDFEAPGVPINFTITVIEE
jgi:hypothetical protein